MDKLMLDRLETVLARYNQIQEDLQNDEVIANIKKYTELSRESRQLEPTTVAYTEYKNAIQTIEEAKILLGEDDPEMVEMAKIEMAEAQDKIAELEEKLKVLLLPKDPNDERNVIMEIRGAAGGDEGNIFAGDLFRMYSRFAESNGYKIEINESNETEFGGYSLISFMIIGEGAYSKFKYESGAHRVQRVPKTESQGRIHTSTATVLVMPEAEEVDVQINPSDLRIDTYRASGAGGQHVNKTDSAIRITHIPTGIVAECQDGRSQHDNRAQAMLMIRTRVLDAIIQKQESERHKERQSKIGSGDRSEKIRTYNYPQNRVTDHRIGLTIQSLDRIMEGDMENVISSLINEDLKLKLEGQEL